MTGMRQTNMYPSTCGYYSACDVSHLPFILPPLFTAGRISPTVGGWQRREEVMEGSESEGEEILALWLNSKAVLMHPSAWFPLWSRGDTHTRERAHTYSAHESFSELAILPTWKKVLQPVRLLLLVIHSNYFPSVTLKLAPNPPLLIFFVCLLTRIYILFYLCRSSSSSSPLEALHSPNLTCNPCTPLKWALTWPFIIRIFLSFPFLKKKEKKMLLSLSLLSL